MFKAVSFVSFILIFKTKNLQGSLSNLILAEILLFRFLILYLDLYKSDIFDSNI